MRISDWSSDVCSSDLGGVHQPRGSGGNPMLRPYLAKQFDFGYEHYFGSTGLFQAGVFYKWLESFVGGGTIHDFDYRGSGLTYPTLPTDAPPGAPTLEDRKSTRLNSSH